MTLLKEQIARAVRMLRLQLGRTEAHLIVRRARDLEKYQDPEYVRAYVRTQVIVNSWIAEKISKLLMAQTMRKLKGTQ